LGLGGDKVDRLESLKINGWIRRVLEDNISYSNKKS
jgi:hypothetical protein